MDAVLRGLSVYFFVWALFRIAGKRTLSAAMFMIGRTVTPAVLPCKICTKCHARLLRQWWCATRLRTSRSAYF